MPVLRGGVRPLAALVCDLFGDFALMRATKLAIAAALRTDAAVAELLPGSQIFSVERVTIPILPSIEVIAVSSERVDTSALIRHELSVEITASHTGEDAADESLDAIVRAVRRRLSAGRAVGGSDCPGGRRGRSGCGARDTLVYLGLEFGRRHPWRVRRPGGRWQRVIYGSRCGFDVP